MVSYIEVILLLLPSLHISKTFFERSRVSLIRLALCDCFVGCGDRFVLAAEREQDVGTCREILEGRLRFDRFIRCL